MMITMTSYGSYVQIGGRRVYFTKATLNTRLEEMRKHGVVSLLWLGYTAFGEWECKLTTRGISCVGYGEQPYEAVREVYTAWKREVGMKSAPKPTVALR